MSISVSAATASTWNSHAAWSRLQSARQKLSDDLSPATTCAAVLTSDRAAVTNAEHEVARIEAVRAADMAHLKATGQTFDLMV
ncbi:hypothetical protein [Actinoplanes aureus]|uniref:Uncharacterized protein n=1 Tax=Actinoplanes aureus TaxID=2792083 RepID=A0A931FZ23_9ACTN|nr:hypothetical protein [Actinoplanes aureus]MBG0562531.1 hypothetical protein [Actinoplanes aureus]